MVKKTSCSLKYTPKLKNLCTPAMLYFVLSLVILAIVGIQNINGNDESLCMGQYECTVGSKTALFLLNVVYVLFWTFVLDLICKAGYSELSWFIFLIPFLLFFLFVGIIMYNGSV